jgi:hypothetical protein
LPKNPNKYEENNLNQHDSAEILAIRVLGWLIAQPDELGAFLNQSGIDTGQIAAMASEPTFLAAVLDFLLEADVRVIAFCDDQGLNYGEIGQARARLPGGDLPNWT